MNSEESHKSARKRPYDAVFRNQPAKKIGEFRYVLEKEAENLQYWRCEYVRCPGRCRTDHNFRVVAGPSNHLQELHDRGHSAASRETEGFNGGDISTAMQLDRTATGKGTREGTRGDAQETSREVPARRKQEQEQKKREKKKRKPLHEETHREELHQHKRHHPSGSPVGEQLATDLINSDRHVPRIRIFKQEPPLPSQQASAVAHEASGAPCYHDDQKTQRLVNVHAGSPGKSLARGGSLLLPESPVKSPVEYISPRQPFEASISIKKEAESDDDRSTLSLEDDDNNVDKESTSGQEAAGSNVHEAVQRCERGTVEEEGRSAGNYCTRRSHVSAVDECNRPLNAERKLSQAEADYEASAVGDGDANRPGTSASRDGETEKKADDKRLHESANRLLADGRSQEPSTIYREHSEEVPRLACATIDSRERELRAAVLICMRRLLEVETELANQERCNEAVRGMMLRRQLFEVVLKMKPPVPSK